MYKRYRFPANIIKQAPWRYFRFNLSRPEIEDLLAQPELLSVENQLDCGAINLDRNTPQACVENIRVMETLFS